MAKITRKTQKVFADSASNNGQFGSAQLGTKVLSNDPDVIQALSAFLNGWDDATLSSENLPTLEEMQALQYLATRQIAYIMQEGIVEYDVGTTYYTNSIVKKAGTYELYGSLINDNIGNALPSQVSDANWQYLGNLTNLGADLSLYAQLAVAQEWTKTQNFNATTLIDATTIAWDLESNQVSNVTITASRTLGAPTNQVDGATYILIVKQDGVGGHALAFDSTYKFAGASAPTLTTDPNAIDILTFVSDGTNMYGVAQLAFG